MNIGIPAYLLVCVAALAVSGLTLFSGFGLGTLLMPVFALFFPIEVAVAATAVVHLSNNLFKLGLLWKHTDWRAVVRFAIPAAVMAMLGALLLTTLSHMHPLKTYTLGGSVHDVTAVKVVIGVLITLFAIFELLPSLESSLQFGRKTLPLGGAMSGFFGGLSGHQGALRSAVLIRAGLSKEAFIATGVVCSVVVDIFRLMVYGITFFSGHFEQVMKSKGVVLVGAATLAAFVGAFVGSRLMKKGTMNAVKKLVGVTLIMLAIGLGAGLI